MDAKSQILHHYGVLNAHPHGVTDPAFVGNRFFDPRDLVLVKYEMLRRVRVEGLSITRAVARFGFSRPVYYATRALFENQGLLGLIPRRPGPRHAHKLSPLVVEFLQQHKARVPALRAVDLALLVRERFGIAVHPRSIERVLAEDGKRGR